MGPYIGAFDAEVWESLQGDNEYGELCLVIDQLEHNDLGIVMLHRLEVLTAKAAPSRLPQRHNVCYPRWACNPIVPKEPALTTLVNLYKELGNPEPPAAPVEPSID